MQSLAFDIEAFDRSRAAFESVRRGGGDAFRDLERDAARLRREFDQDAWALERFGHKLGGVERAIRNKTLAMGEAERIVAGMTQKLGVMANADQLAARGQDDLARAVRGANAAIEAQNRAVMRGRMPGADNDNSSMHRRTNLGYQAFDVGQGLAAGTPWAIIAAQQGPQIAQLYAGQGGFNAAMKDAAALAVSAARAMWPLAAAGAAVWGAYELIGSYSAEAAFGVDATTAALARQAAPFDAIDGKIRELITLHDRWREMIDSTSIAQSTASDLAVANTQREYEAKRSLLELELKRQQAAIAAQRAEIAITGHQLKGDLGQSVFTRMDLERRGMADPRIGSVPFVRIPDAISGLDKTWQQIGNSPLNDKLKELKANLDLTEIGAQKLEEALKQTFGASYSSSNIPIPPRRGVDDVPLRGDGMNFTDRWENLRKVDQDALKAMKDAISEADKAVMESRSTFRGFIGDLSEAIAKGEKLGDVLRNAFSNLAGRIGDRALDQIAALVFPTSKDPGGSLGPWGIFGSLLGRGAANDNFRGAANDNWAGMRGAGAPVLPVERRPLGPVNMAAARDAIASIESAGSGGYAAIGPTHPTMGRALGRYQVMEANVGPWSSAALGRTLTPGQFLASPSAQDAVFDHRFGGYIDRFGARGAAQAWFGGEGSVGKLGRSDVLGTTVGGYGDRFVKIYDEMSGAAGKTSAALDTVTTGALGAGKGLGGLADGLGKIVSGVTGGQGWGLGNLFGTGLSNTGAGFMDGRGGGLGGMLGYGGGGGGLGGMLGGAISWIGSLFGFAEGTNFAPGGWSIIGERGPELMNVPRGAQILSNERSRRLMAEAGRGEGRGETIDIVLRDDSGRMAEIAQREYRTREGNTVRLAVERSHEAVRRNMPDLMNDSVEKHG